MHYKVKAGSTIFAGAWDGVFKSNDGVKWVSSSKGLRNADCTTILGLGNYLYSLCKGQVYVSNNGIWRNTNFPSLANESASYAVTSGNNVILATSRTVYYSDNQGSSWSQSAGIPAYVLCMTSSGNSVFASVPLRRDCAFVDLDPT